MFPQKKLVVKLLPNVQPGLFPESRFPLVKSEFHCAPPEAIRLAIEQLLTVTVPLANDNVALGGVPVVLSVILLPDVPDTENALDNVVVVPAVKVIVAG